ncbi:class I SAM-dependent methyltransferase [Bacillus horti]|uniref:SAM-dependent methyltransferase n=1 Tax=Caldalkalibacillus horti TaxID=77523 RepID=A0ABT9VXL0_9BACI|nr:class I SAM-dependent methyltransferase [Bacillus horti]MDQ0165729.1 SAM-dependent methyltransferase [Bacillus horti]
MNKNKLKEQWLSEEKKSFEGWDFSYITKRVIGEPLPWDYDKIVRQYLIKDFILLDMGTGGGEYLLTLNHPYSNTYVTEAYPPNYDLCKRKLSPLGIRVRQVVDDANLPFENSMFDIIINRHESFDIHEINRILKPNGLFITQQVGGQNNKELAEYLLGSFEEITNSDFALDRTIEWIRGIKFKVLFSNEYFPRLKFIDVGALVYLAKIIEWEFPSFSVEHCFEQLCKLQSTIDRQGFIETKEHRFMIVAQKAV